MTLQHSKLICLLSAGLSLGACNWVDSTGVQSGATGGTTGSGQVSRTIELTEKGVTTVAPAIDPASADTEWTWGQPVETGALEACRNINGFDVSAAAPSLSAACTREDDCNIDFEFKRDDSDQVEFAITLPSLKAPVGLAYTLNARRDDGAELAENFTLCAIAINEAPTARDDSFVLPPRTTTLITATDARHLLSNDADDVDVRNQGLKVLAEPARAPQFAAEFELFADGGFLYRPQPTVTQSNRVVNDSFMYTVTDGQHPSTATVTLRIVDDRNNTPPSLDELDDLVLTQGESFTIDIDADDDNEDSLLFSLSAGTPDFVAINANSGKLSGTAEAVGSHTITVTASDGLAEASASFMLFVLEDGNNPPFADDIRNNAVSGRFSYNVSGFFGDRDGDKLTFTATGMPPGVSISNNGIIRGTASAANRGRHIIRVFVDDGRGGTASDGFRLVIS